MAQKIATIIIFAMNGSARREWKVGAAVTARNEWGGGCGGGTESALTVSLMSGASELEPRRGNEQDLGQTEGMEFRWARHSFTKTVSAPSLYQALSWEVSLGP